MSVQSGAAGPVPRLAPALNSACQCIWLDRERLDRQLAERLGNDGLSLASHPGLAAGGVVFVDAQDAAAMDRTAGLIEGVLSSPAALERVAAQAPPIAHVAGSAGSGVLGFDFHLGGDRPQLIEINTNPGGLLVNLELARALTACCDALEDPVERMAAGDVALEELPARIVAGFRAAWSALRGDTAPATIAIVDDDPAAQYLYQEFRLYQRLFERAGWRASVVDAAALELRDGALWANGERVDLVYNRVTDFYLVEERHSALRRALETGAAVVTPDPAAHARWADKRLLAWLCEEALLEAAGLDAGERRHLLESIPTTEIVTPEAADSLWKRRKSLFFKPVDGHGSKAAYRGSGLTRSTFGHILAGRYVAQAVAPTSTRRVVVGNEATDLRVDVRSYRHAGETWLRAARLYRGQTTNFRTPGGGFAPVLTLPADPGAGAGPLG
jgi:hypothetical protein